MEVKKLDENARAPISSFWTDGYLPPEYLLAEDYLECCAAAVRGGEPTAAIMDQLNAWWKSLMPRKILELLEENCGWEYLEED